MSKDGQSLITDFVSPPQSPVEFVLQVYLPSHGGWVFRGSRFRSGVTTWSSEAGAVDWVKREYPGHAYIVWRIGGVEWEASE